MARKSRPSRHPRKHSNTKGSGQAVEADKPTGRNWSTYVLAVLTVAVIGGLVAAAVVGRGGSDPIDTTPPQSPASANAPAEVHLVNHTYRTDGPRNLYDLLKLPEEEVEQLDIALINLLCAQVLPGADDIDIDGILATLDQWAAHVESETNRNLYKFYQAPAEYDNSEARWRMAVLVTVLQQDCGVRYNPERIRDVDFTHSEDLFIHGLARPGMTPVQAVSDPEGAKALLDSTNGGTCVSMPVIYTAIARRLGYPVTLSTTQEHVFCRWDGQEHANPMYRDYFNIEGTNRGFNLHDDAYYLGFPKQISQEYADAHDFLTSLTNLEALAGFLATRGHCLLDTGRLQEAYNAYSAAVRRHPGQPHFRQFMRHAHAQWDRKQQRLAAGNPSVYDPQRHLEEINRINAENRRRQEEEWRRLDPTNASIPGHFTPVQTHPPTDPFAPPHQGF